MPSITSLLAAFTTILAATSTTTLGSPTPRRLAARAGGPLAVPIPTRCTTLNPLPHAGSWSGSANGTTVANVGGWRPSSEFSTAHQVYSSFYDASYQTHLDAATFCFEQCYGFGEPGTCVSALIASAVPIPSGQLGSGLSPTACFMFNATLSPSDFVQVGSSGEWANETAIDIYC